MSDTTTIRVKKELYNTVKSIAKEKNKNMQDILDEAIQDYKKREFFDSLNAAYAKLKTNPKVWKEAENEREVWDTILLDGLEE
jgi:predicted transcriptional regulator